MRSSAQLRVAVPRFTEAQKEHSQEWLCHDSERHEKEHSQEWLCHDSGMLF